VPGVLATVHYGQDYDNAFWNGTQLVFGDGDRRIFDRFTKPIDVLGHELSHALTEKTAGLTYQGQSGALNESISDVFGACMKQRVLGQAAADADWLVGEGIFLPSVHGTALRSMKEPGTAYDDPDLGKDPQVGSMADYVETTEDNGGCTSTPASPTVPSSWRPRPSAAARPRVPAGSGTPRSRRASAPTPTSRASRRPPSRPPASTPARSRQRGPPWASSPGRRPPGAHPRPRSRPSRCRSPAAAASPGAG
jgi:hypothetical protein